MKSEHPDVPVAIIIYNRPTHTQTLINSLRLQKPKKVYAIADGPKNASELDKDLVGKSRAALQAIDWPCDIQEVFADSNLGLRQRVLSGLDVVFENEERAIILEDDCIPDSTFFKYCEELLVRYEFEKNVGIISGHNAATFANSGNSYFFSSFTPIWGWATWGRTWREFRKADQLEKWSKNEIADVLSTFTTRFFRKQFSKMMLAAEKLNTWDISFAVFLRQKRFVNAIPSVSLISNIGFGQQSTHTKFKPFDIEIKSGRLTFPLKHPEGVSEDPSYEPTLYRKKLSSWLSYPVLHPVEFLRRMFKFLTLRLRG